MRDPYHSLRLFASALNAILITVALWSASQAERMIKDGGREISEVWLTAALYFVLPLIIWIATSFLLAPLLLKSILLRRAILLNRYVEGKWLETVKLTDGTQAIAVITIEPLGESFYLSGKTYDANFNYQSSFIADYHEFSWPLLKYKHTNQSGDSSQRTRPQEGVAELNFESLNYYTGFFHHLSSAKRNITEAYKIKTADVPLLGSASGRRQLLDSSRSPRPPST